MNDQLRQEQQRDQTRMLCALYDKILALNDEWKRTMDALSIKDDEMALSVDDLSFLRWALGVNVRERKSA